MYPNCEHVEYAITFFISFCTNPIVAAINAVNPPIIVINFNVVDVYSNNGDILIIKNTPAVTIVAAWIKADTGVGPSIASGNHVCNPICADFPITPINKLIPIIVNIDTENPNIVVVCPLYK